MRRTADEWSNPRRPRKIVQLDMDAALQAKETGLALIVAASTDGWLSKARHTALVIWRETHEPLTSDDVKVRIGEPERENLAGALFRRSYGWHPVGWRPSARPSSHARILRTWVYRGVAA